MSDTVAYWQIVGEYGRHYPRRYARQEDAQAVLDAFGPISGKIVGLNASGKVVEPPGPHWAERDAHFIATFNPERVSQMLSREKRLEAEVASWKRKAEEATQAHTSLTETYSQVARRDEQLEAVVEAARRLAIPRWASEDYRKKNPMAEALTKALAALDAAPLQGEKEPPDPRVRKEQEN